MLYSEVVVNRKLVLLGTAPAVNGVAYFRANPWFSFALPAKSRLFPSNVMAVPRWSFAPPYRICSSSARASNRRSSRGSSSKRR